MLQLLDKLLSDVLANAGIGLTLGQVRFEPPIKGWQTNAGANHLALNIYLADLRENRKLRSNERVRDMNNGVVVEDPAPARLDCHYLVSAWSAANQQVAPIFDEHALLYATAAVLTQHGSLNPSRVYPGNPVPPNNWPTRFFDTELPVTVAPAEGFPKLAEFWSGMGQGSYWKPVLYLVVTVPVALARTVSGLPVTSRIAEFDMLGGVSAGEVWVQIGGHVLDTANPLPNNQPAPVPRAWVQLATTAGEPLQITETDADGRFRFGDLRPGTYQLRARAVGMGEKRLPNIHVPAETSDEYDLRFP